ncbi:hypothetical protein [Erwinia piriflorinigrans]|uniref:Uncharacterized protein n=1 Tax=Erwinia piriflorinigrans CFBP 5888 TaxID=1161919 RepID=V5Z8Z1_9GAMM|nr:hypothetical protein [Erwinia piriflorinigrans]CCG87418.1 hypothetical protein EPIR_2053 [Erwinia piriflorinigrans CFBP 5888]
MFSRDPRLNMHLNNGAFNLYPLYIHYTTLQGYRAIKAAGCISANPNKERRGSAAKKGVYLALAKDAMSNEDAHSILFLGEEKYLASATYCFVFYFNQDPYLPARPVSHGSYSHEVICPQDINFKQINIIYDGLNPFI